MTPEQLAELKQALTEGMAAGFEGVTAQLQQTHAATPPADPPEDPVIVMLKGMESKLTAMQQEQAELKSKLETLEKTPVNRRHAAEHGSDADDGKKRDTKGHYS